MVRHLPRDARAVPSRVASVPLTPQASVHVVQWNGQEFLLACTSQQVTVLSQRPADNQEAP
jgi:flagellar biogenesis protein FliO